ncbi:GreA/GreB family elongation factor [Nocardia cyriacigeorgica]|uniref:GreA/GreB family elongation factor n=1 Tax=Nocardia cyriacigeorgica TaxID=135487 RepID=UPI0018932F29|nr:GreA/GreB family elongation factor [Nocardia cyriacigeorgica]MBF6315749.1 GreA/GreB family elongation factor [Nocardia cyriacigeorgica]MBF6530534.1 GreA/GreB family elongation factor [Nocardia cyriacigeorgica]
MTLPKNVISLMWSNLVLSELNADGAIERQFDYIIVPDAEADDAESKFAASLPASQALLGHVVGDIVETEIDGRPVRVRVQAVGNG